jgi:hypothetical protein
MYIPKPTSKRQKAIYYMVNTGGTLGEIFTELWPEAEFKIARKFGEDIFTLRITTTDALDQTLLNQIWQQLDQQVESIATQSSSTQTGNCLDIIAMNQLDQYKYTPQNGILKRNESNRTQIKLDGYSLAELAEILTQEKRLGRFFVEKGKDGPTYSFQLNVSSVNTLRDSLRLYGITLKSCKRAVSLYELK